MGFWAIEVEPGITHPYDSGDVQGKLHITKATLGNGLSEKNSILQCSVADMSPIFLCNLLPNENECCPLDLELDEDDSVVFSILGPRSIHLSGYFVANSGVKIEEMKVQADEKMENKTSEGTEKKKAKDSSDHGRTKKRKLKTVDQDYQPERDLDSDGDGVPSKNNTKMKKKKKAKASEGDKGSEKIVSATEEKNESALASKDQKTVAKSTKVRAFSNGMVIEELVKGKPGGKKATLGKQVSVHFIGKLQANGKTFRSNFGIAKPFKFRLGFGQVIRGWDFGINGMRVGDIRRLTIPPAMGYGLRGTIGVPTNAWLVYDVQLDEVVRHH